MILIFFVGIRVTPRSLGRARLGGIVARLLSEPSLNLVGARMLEPSPQMQKEYVDILKETALEDNYVDNYESAVIHFVENNLSREKCISKGHNNRTMWLLFSGENTVKDLNRLIGNNVPGPEDAGRTIRSTFGDLFLKEGSA